MLSQDAITHYRTKGWVVVNEVFSRDEAEKIAELALQISTEELKDAKGSYQADKAADGKTAPRKIDHPYHKSEAFRAFATNPRLVALLRELMGVEPLLCTDQIFMKPPRFGSAKPYHQDNAYFQCAPADHVITAWIALDDVDEENGCLRYIDGSHKEGILPHDPVPGEPHNKAPAPNLIDLKRESLAIVRKGGVVFHHSGTLHTSHRNESDRWRRAYATHWVAADVTSTSEVLEKAYFKEADCAKA
jgi:ectoine hydroxylase-related dioxygenase (phytanoyl-CoA dioxygenase family)